jgi:hypothetical protein
MMDYQPYLAALKSVDAQSVVNCASPFDAEKSVRRVKHVGEIVASIVGVAPIYDGFIEDAAFFFEVYFEKKSLLGSFSIRFSMFGNFCTIHNHYYEDGERFLSAEYRTIVAALEHQDLVYVPDVVLRVTYDGILQRDPRRFDTWWDRFFQYY